MYQWFYDNYIEEPESINKIIDETCVKSACSFQALYEACRMVLKMHPERNVLRLEAKYFGMLANAGVSGRKAAETHIKALQIFKSNIKTMEIDKLRKMIADLETVVIDQAYDESQDWYTEVSASDRFQAEERARHAREALTHLRALQTLTF